MDNLTRLDSPQLSAPLAPVPPFQERHEWQPTDYIRIAKRRWYLIPSLAVVLALLAYIAAIHEPKQFVSIGDVMIQSPETVSSETMSSGQFNQIAGILGIAAPNDQGTQIAEMTSDAALSEVEARTGLSEPLPVLRGQFSLAPDKNSTEVLDISATASSARLAASLVQTIVAVYNDKMGEQSSTAVGRMAAATYAKMVSVGQRLSAAEEAKSEYVKSIGSIDPTTQTPQVVGQYYSLKGQLLDLQKSLAVAEEDQEYNREQMKILDPSIIPSLNFSTNPRIEGDKASLEQLEQQRVQLSSQFTPVDQQMVDNQNQIDIIKQQMANERTQESQNFTFSLKASGADDTALPDSYVVTGATKQLNPLRESARSAISSDQATIESDHVQEQVLSNALANYQQLVNTTPDSLRKMQDLQATVDVLRSIYGDLQTQNAQMEARLPAEMSYATFLTSPTLPKKQTSPRPILYSVIAGVMGLLVGFIVSVMLDSGDQRLRDSKDAELLFGQPLLQRISCSKISELSLSENENLEPYRQLAYTLGYLGVGRSIRTILVTSAIRDEGASSVASNLAVALSNEGQRVILVDANVKKPVLHVLFGQKNNVGLAGLMKNGAVPEHALVSIDGKSSLSLIPGGDANTESDYGHMLNADKFELILANLREKADIVIVDAPAVFAGFETSVLADKVDGIVFVSRVGSTSRSSVRKAFDLLQNCRAPIIGTVLNGAKE